MPANIETLFVEQSYFKRHLKNGLCFFTDYSRRAIFIFQDRQFYSVRL
jgi:hypothetical protein